MEAFWNHRTIALIARAVLVVGLGSVRGSAQSAGGTGDAGRGADLFGTLPCASSHDLLRRDRCEVTDRPALAGGRSERRRTR
jgi:hypothetical protein